MKAHCHSSILFPFVLSFFLSRVHLAAQKIYLLVKPMPELWGRRQRDKRLLETTNQYAGEQQTSNCFQSKNRTRLDGEIRGTIRVWFGEPYKGTKRSATVILCKRLHLYFTSFHSCGQSVRDMTVIYNKWVKKKLFQVQIHIYKVQHFATFANGEWIKYLLHLISN